MEDAEISYHRSLAVPNTFRNTLNLKEKDFQASSPDEITFVKIVEKLGIILKSRTQTDITIVLPSGK